MALLLLKLLRIMFLESFAGCNGTIKTGMHGFLHFYVYVFVLTCFGPDVLTAAQVYCESAVVQEKRF